MPAVQAVHALSKTEIRRLALRKRAAGELYDRTNAQIEETFVGSIDRFCDIAVAFRHARAVLDIGAGNGLLLAILKLLGHEVHGVDFFDRTGEDVYARHGIAFRVCNVEADPLPFDTASMDAVSCCQALEHFTHSHLPAVLEIRRRHTPSGPRRAGSRSGTSSGRRRAGTRSPSPGATRIARRLRRADLEFRRDQRRRHQPGLDPALGPPHDG